MFNINENYRKLRAGYLFPEIARRVKVFTEQNPDTGKRIINCGIGDVTEPLPDAVVDAMKKAVDELASRETFRGYGPPTGELFLRETIVNHECRAQGIEFEPDEVFISDGSKGDCGHVLEVLGKNNRIGVADPVYPVYVDTNVMWGHTGVSNDDGQFDGLVYLPATADNGFVPSIPECQLDVIYLCYPNNPTGSMITRDQLEAWVEYVLNHDSIILYDAAYQAFISETDLPRTIYEIDGADRCAMEFHSFSKNAGFTGVRCGYTICPKKLHGAGCEGERINLNALWTRRWNTRSNGVSYPVQRGAEAVYSRQGQEQVNRLIAQYMENAGILRVSCEALGLKCWGGVNAPYVWIACPDGISSWEMFDRILCDANVVVTPGAGFGPGGEGYFRLSAFQTRENISTVVQRLAEISLQPV